MIAVSGHGARRMGLRGRVVGARHPHAARDGRWVQDANNCAIAIKRALELNKKYPQLKLSETDLEELPRRANADRDAARR
ncbi:MAG: hypothetical protein ACE15C_18345 [Phycisphaerae bacterium]